MRLKAFTAFVLLLSFPPALVAAIDFDAIKTIESKGDPLAVSSRTKKKIERGLYQVSEPALKDYNRAHKTRITPRQLFDREINAQVARWYMLEKIPQMLRANGAPVTRENMIIAYNAGISYFMEKKKVPRRTRKYISDYNTLTKKGI